MSEKVKRLFDFEKNIRDKNKLQKIDIQELMKYGKNNYFENRKAEFKDSFGYAFVLEENYVAYLYEKDLLLRYIRKYVVGISPDEVEEKDFGITTNDLLINGDKVQWVSRFKSRDTEMFEFSEEEKRLYERADEIVKKAEEKDKAIRKAEKQHIRNFFKKLFRSRKMQTAISEESNITELEIEKMIKSVEEEKPISAYRVEGNKQVIIDENQKNKDKQSEKETGDEEVEL